MDKSTEDYNEEPVLFCKECLSLKVKNYGDIDYCEECGSTEIESSDIHTWEEKYKERYKKEYLSNKEVI